jgi:putative peptide zinc metalloprotease protein
VFGLPAQNPLSMRGRDVFVRVYGIATLVWRWLVIVTLLIAAAHLLHGVGLILALLTAAGLVVGIVRGLQPVFAPLSLPQRVKAGLRVAVLGALLFALGGLMSWQERIAVPVLVDHEGAELVRSPLAGFVRDVMVRPGQVVALGAPLARIENADLSLQAHLNALELEQSNLRLRKLRSTHQLVDAQHEAVRNIRLELELDAVQVQLAQLHITAPRAGVIDAQDLATLPGRYLKAGDELMRVLNPAEKRVRASLPEDLAAGLQGQIAEIRLPHRAPLMIAMTENSPRASRHIADAAFAAPHGGPLAVRMTDEAAAERRHLEFLDARIEWQGRLAPHDAATLYAGELGTAYLRGAHISALAWLSRSTRSWLSQVVEQQENQ